MTIKDKIKAYKGSRVFISYNNYRDLMLEIAAQDCTKPLTYDGKEIYWKDDLDDQTIIEE